MESPQTQHQQQTYGNMFQQAQNMISNLFSSKFPLVSMKSTVDGQVYRVRDLPDKQEAANLLATVRRKLTTLCDTLEKKYPDKPQVKMIQKNFRSDPMRFLEATPESNHTSYSVNKGESIHLCLRQRQASDESLVKADVIIFVALHELAHVCTESVGHDATFWNNFGWLLQEAEAAGIYQRQNFQAHPASYCGIYITDSPSYDATKDGTDNSIGRMYKRVPSNI
jgi:predicted metal-dependent hydrolase